jgi:hypothetical protein
LVIPSPVSEGEEAAIYSLAGAKDDPDEQNEATSVAEPMSLSAIAAAHAPRRHRSPLRTLIEVVSGAVSGCLVAYYGLALYYGAHFDSLGLPKLSFLPWIDWLTRPS